MIRGELWYIISGAKDLKVKNKNVYKQLCERKSICEDKIEKDIKRTYIENQPNKLR